MQNEEELHNDQTAESVAFGMSAAFPEPYLLEFPRIGGAEIGFISIGEFEDRVPFLIKRAFWTYRTPTDVLRGQHAHHTTEEILIAVAGQITVTCETKKGGLQTFLLDRPDQGLYRPPHAWTTMSYSADAVQMVLASTLFDEGDYIRNYKRFQAVWMK